VRQSKQKRDGSVTIHRPVDDSNRDLASKASSG
jgi:hypothetical protein